MKSKSNLSNIFTYVVLTVISVFINIPLIAMIGTALKTNRATMTTFTLFPRQFDISTFKTVLLESPFGINLINSLYIATTVTIACIIIASFAGYAISRFKGLFFSVYSILLLALQMIPRVLLLIPLFILFKHLNLIDTSLSVMISYTAIGLPFSTWMLKGFFDTIPISLEESAMIDGCSRFQSYYKIVLPLAAPGIASVGIFTFILAWNEYLFASVFLRSESNRTITIGLERFVQQYSSQWAELMSASTLATIPAIIILLFAQKYLIRGLTAGSVKG